MMMMRGAHHQVARAVKTATATKSPCWKASLRFGSCSRRRCASSIIAEGRRHAGGSTSTIDSAAAPTRTRRCFASSSPLPEESPPVTTAFSNTATVDVATDETISQPSESTIPEPTMPPPLDDRSSSAAAAEPGPMMESAMTAEADGTTNTAGTKSPTAAAAAAARGDIISSMNPDFDDDFASEFDEYPETANASAQSPAASSSSASYRDYCLHPGATPEDHAFWHANTENEKNQVPMEERIARYRRAYYSGRSFFEAWTAVWASGQTPFDLGRPTPALAEALERKGMKFSHIMVPGFGSGHDLVTLAKHNPGSSIWGVEISGNAMYKAEKVLKKAYTDRVVTEAKVDLICGDFFNDKHWDIYYDFAPENFTPEALQKQKEEEEMQKRYEKGHWVDEEYEEENIKREYDDDLAGDKDGDNAKDKKMVLEEDSTRVDGDSAKEEDDAKAASSTTVKDENGVTNVTEAESTTKTDGAINGKDEEQVEGNSGGDVAAAAASSSPSSDNDDKTTRPLPDDLAMQEPKIGDDNPEKEVPAMDQSMKDLIQNFMPKKEGEEDQDRKKLDESIPVGFDLIYDYGFFSALPKRSRIQYAERMAEFLTPQNGRLLTIMYPVDDLGCAGPMEGPPFYATVQDYVTLFEPLGLVMEGEPYASPDTIPSRVGQELICWWRRGDPPPKEKKKKEKKPGDWEDDDDEPEFDIDEAPPGYKEEEGEEKDDVMKQAMENFKRGKGFTV